MSKLLQNLSINYNPFLSKWEKMQVKTIISDDISTQLHIASLLSLLAKSIDSKIIIDIGTFRGVTTAKLALANPQAKVFTFEKDEKILVEANKLFSSLNLKNIQAIYGDILETLPAFLLTLNEPIDFAFLDDAKKNYSANFSLVANQLKVGGIIAAHDTFLEICNNKHTIDFRKQLEQTKSFSVINVDVKDRGLTIAQKIKEGTW